VPEARATCALLCLQYSAVVAHLVMIKVQSVDGSGYNALLNLKHHILYCTTVPVTVDARRPPQVQDISAEAGAAPSFELVEAVHYWEVPIASAGPLENPVRAPCVPPPPGKAATLAGSTDPARAGPMGSPARPPCRPRAAVPLTAPGGQCGSVLALGPP